MEIKIDGLQGAYEIDKKLAKLGTLILSRLQVEKWEPIEKYPLISIRDEKEKPLGQEVKDRYLNVLEVVFDDILEACIFEKAKVMSLDDAGVLYNYFWRYEGFPMVIHCRGGVSRSSGVALARAIVLHYWKTVGLIISSDKFCHNSTIIKKVIDYAEMINNNPFKTIR